MIKHTKQVFKTKIIRTKIMLFYICLKRIRILIRGMALVHLHKLILLNLHQEIRIIIRIISIRRSLCLELVKIYHPKRKIWIYLKVIWKRKRKSLLN